LRGQTIRALGRKSAEAQKNCLAEKDTPAWETRECGPKSNEARAAPRERQVGTGRR